MFWWLWSPRKKVVSLLVLAVVVAIPVVLLGGRGDAPVATPVGETATSSPAPAPTAASVPDTPTATSSPSPTPSRPSPSAPLRFAEDASRSATSVLPRVFLPLRDALVRDVLLPEAGSDGYSLYVSYVDVESVEGLAGQQMIYLQQFGAMVSVSEVGSEHFRVTAAGEDQGVSYSAQLQVIRAGRGAVISGVVRITGTPLPLTAAEIAELEALQETRRTGGTSPTTESPVASVVPEELSVAAPSAGDTATPPQP